MRTAYVPESSIWRAFGSSLPPRFITAGVRLRLTASRWLSMSSIQSAASRWLVAQSVLYRLLPICPDTCPARRPSRPIGHLWCFSIWIFQMIVCWFGVEQVQWAQLEVWGSLLIKTSNREARGAALLPGLLISTNASHLTQKISSLKCLLPPHTSHGLLWACSSLLMTPEFWWRHEMWLKASPDGGAVANEVLENVLKQFHKSLAHWYQVDTI